jgi:hypothetical protein
MGSIQFVERAMGSMLGGRLDIVFLAGIWKAYEN